MVKRRNSRQDAIREIVRDKSIKTQRALVEELEAAGYTCTQATISRDIADMGLRKLPEGVYVLAEDLHLQRMVSELVVSVIRANNIVVVRSQAGTAQGVAAAIDAAGLPDVAGSIAGDDTIMVVCITEAEAISLEQLINKLRNVRK
ncbi:arginine repressor [Olsenella uli]|uniref:arginine repressor n=1 Tax=Olsenella uli TaxID=133926 RepID=UPI0012ABEB7D|nr:ArgR family transcriptional regulator [Olsenella uli]